MSKKVVVAGHVCIDITPSIRGQKVSEIGQMLLPGKLIHVGEVDVHTGGSVANTGLAMKMLGADVFLAGKIGNDSFGNMVELIMKRYGVEKGLIRRDGESTAYSIVLAVPGVDRIFLHHPGANDTFTVEDLSDELLQGASLFHFGYPPLMRKMYENDGQGLVEVLKKARKAETVISMDLAMVDPNSEAGKADWENILKEALPYVDIFVPSFEELCFMLDRERFNYLQERAGKQDICEILNLNKDILPLAKKCMEMGVKILLIKCGSLGMYYRTAAVKDISQITSKLDLNVGDWAEKEGFEMSYTPEQVLSGTGAGDTSIAAFLTSLLNRCTPEKCVQYATAMGASCVAAYDALSGLKSFEELEKKIKDGWAKN